MIAALLDAFQPGRTIYLPGATGELLALAEALAAEPDRLRGVHVMSCLLPGMNHLDYASGPDSRVTTFLLPRELHASFVAGRVQLLPLTYSQIALYLSRDADIDVAVAHLSPPSMNGECSFGLAADFSPLAWRRARFRIAAINPNMPRMQRGPTVSLKDADLVVECASPLVEVTAARVPETARLIARRAAVLVPDGAAIQLGIGGAPAAMCQELTQHRGLRVRSGLVPEAVRCLDDAGALADDSTHCVGIAAGSADFYAYLAERDLTAFADTRTTHGFVGLSALKGFTAINSALEVDLFGQANLEWQGRHLSSGVGGAPDFARAAAASEGGRSMILMPATARGGETSRIVARIDAPAVSLARTDVDTVITEHGVAELRHKSPDQRARALIAIAEPPFRDRLEEAWSELRMRI